MTVGELKEKLNQYDDNLEVMTKKTNIFGNVAYVNNVKVDAYGDWVGRIPCILLTDEE